MKPLSLLLLVVPSLLAWAWGTWMLPILVVPLLGWLPVYVAASLAKPRKVTFAGRIVTTIPAPSWATLLFLGCLILYGGTWIWAVVSGLRSAP